MSFKSSLGSPVIPYAPSFIATSRQMGAFFCEV
jgi:hypothetical protein